MTPLVADLDIDTVLLVADVQADDSAAAALDQRRDLEKSSLWTVTSVLRAIKDLGLPAIHIRSLEELSERAAQRHPGDVVLSIFGGQRSRNRMALVPAICETFGLRFVGPDVYGRIVCQDKEISKRLALQCGVLTPPYFIVRDAADLARVTSAVFPLVVKPNLEGSSIGISERCLVRDVSSMQQVATYLLHEFDQPVLLEEFVGGAEVCLNLIECGDTLEWRLAEVKVVDDPNYFDSHLFGAEIKGPWVGVDIVPLHGHLTDADRSSLLRLIKSVGAMGY